MLEAYLRSLLNETLRRYPLFAAYVFEAHKGGMPHIHAMLFCLPVHFQKIASLLESHLSRDAVSVEVLSPKYLFKEDTGEWHLKEKVSQILGYSVTKLCRKNAVEYEDGRRKSYKCDVISVVQDRKIIHTMQNYAMIKRYPNAYVELDVFVNSLLEKWNRGFGTRMQRAKGNTIDTEELKRPYYLEKIVLFPPSIQTNRKPEKKQKQKSGAAAVYPLDLDLRAANGEQYHTANCRVFLTEKQLQALKLAAKRQKQGGLDFLIKFLFFALPERHVSVPCPCTSRRIFEL